MIEPRNSCLYHIHKLTRLGEPADEHFEGIYRKHACAFLQSYLVDYHVMVQTDMPQTHVTSVQDELMPTEDLDDASEFTIMRGEESNFLDGADDAVTYTDVALSSTVLCFRTLRSNPSSMHVLPGAPKIRDSAALVTVLEPVIAPYGEAEAASLESHRIMLPNTESDLDRRTIIVSPSTFTYKEMHNMRRATIDQTPIYEFASIQHGELAKSGVGLIVMQGLMRTAQGHQSYIIDQTTTRKHDQLDLIRRLESLGLALVDHICGEQYHCRMTQLGFRTLRTSFQLTGHEMAFAPLPEVVPTPS